jgi:hypothetical protein
VTIVDPAVMQTSKQDPTLFEVIGVVPNILPHSLKGVAVDHRNIVDHFISLQFEVVTQLLHAALVLEQS